MILKIPTECFRSQKNHRCTSKQVEKKGAICTTRQMGEGGQATFTFAHGEQTALIYH